MKRTLNPIQFSPVWGLLLATACNGTSTGNPDRYGEDEDCENQKTQLSGEETDIFGASGQGGAAGRSVDEVLSSFEGSYESELVWAFEGEDSTSSLSIDLTVTGPAILWEDLPLNSLCGDRYVTVPLGLELATEDGRLAESLEVHGLTHSGQKLSIRLETTVNDLNGDLSLDGSAVEGTDEILLMMTIENGEIWGILDGSPGSLIAQFQN